MYAITIIIPSYQMKYLKYSYNNNKSHNNTTKATITTSTLQTKLHHANIMNVKNSYVKLQCI